MKLVTYQSVRGPVVGVVVDGQVHSVVDLVPGSPDTMIGVIGGGAVLLSDIRAALAAATTPGLPLSQTELLEPVPGHGKFLCMGLNYLEHIREGGRDRPVPEFPTLFLRTRTSLLPPGGAIVAPQASERLDYEAELVVVIGKRVRNVDEATALEAVFGYTAFNDGSLRDFQKHTTQWTAGKNFDATGPYGPAIVTADELPSGGAGLWIRSRLNGAIMQDGNTDDMIFSVARIIAYASQAMTLEPGDLIATGTPSGVGQARTPPVFMKPGDVVEIEIEGIPALRNPVVAAA
ncbi:fumarylacetoacetate hydrolase family protein [Aureimonas sp. OT7]|uniref:fumarylacetoacetate hydrolase family protein n=1 Tax=Aureimonas sp. OT7 TaxID=2816454 RepID=UPI001FEF2323|nr:fumarylacetoacetate hydrolase family protein [Aureimonas sp. OT7]